VIFAFQVLPAIIFVSALFAIMYYLGIMQLVVRAFAVVMNKVMGASGAESLNVAASIFMGQTEAPLTIRPFLPRMTRSELMTVMTPAWRTSPAPSWWRTLPSAWMRNISSPR
jgi:CNT family concentrative nucleoside transporter